MPESHHQEGQILKKVLENQIVVCVQALPDHPTSRWSRTHFGLPKTSKEMVGERSLNAGIADYKIRLIM